MYTMYPIRLTAADIAETLTIFLTEISKFLYLALLLRIKLISMLEINTDYLLAVRIAFTEQLRSDKVVFKSSAVLDE